MGGQNSKEKHKSAMFCPTNIVLVAGFVGLSIYRDLPSAEEMLVLVDTRTCTFIYIFLNVYMSYAYRTERYICIL